MSEPKYLQIENTLKNEIRNKKFKYGEVFYSEKELAQKFNVSSITVIRAVKDLVAAGYLIRYQGKGTYVSYSPNNRLVHYQDVTTYPELIEDKNKNEESMDVVSLEKESDPIINTIFKTPKTNFYYHLKQIRKVDNKPFMFYNIYVPLSMINPVKAQNKDNYKNIYLNIQEDCNFYLLDEPFKETHSIIPAFKEVSEALGVDLNTPIIRQERTIASERSGEVLLYMNNYKLSDYGVITLTSANFPED
ncbi:GntR family transcriptional regulator [Lactobacillus sp. PV034]|uniref:GntR family transcriptional regulator n=1 Tax=Lactobacillus sp. PV034 TaxID=2594495 RepID=UPI00223EA38D|nr:GntR family transcriptional regulator [Lactobacillus sp. PV034]QNQ81030.1 GntR family transcriptional regulator [Lactobacillus sp. PV034]